MGEKYMTKNFNFIQEVQESGIDINLLRSMEAYKFLYTFKEDDSEDWAIECLLNNYTDFLALKDDLFLNRLMEIYEEKDLKEMIKEASDIQYGNDIPDEGKIIVGDKKYKINKEISQKV
jgi:hypothetical protein